MTPSHLDERRRTRHRRFATWVTAAVGLGLVLAPPLSLVAQLALAGGVIVLLGLPHGALDAAVALRCAPKLGRTAFFASYLALAAAMLLWIAIHPPSALLAFLALSVLHFGLGDLGPHARRSRHHGLEVLTRGCMPILLPIAFHAGDVGLFFGWLAEVDPQLTASWATRFAPVGLQLMLACWLAWTVDLALHRAESPSDFWELQAEVLVLTLNFLLLPPLVSFAVYFGLWHSLRHLIALDAIFGRDPNWSRRRSILAGLPILALSLAGGLLALRWIGADGVDARAWVRVLFFGLAVVTGPHMLITALVDRALRPSSPGVAPDPSRGRVRAVC